MHPENSKFLLYFVGYKIKLTLYVSKSHSFTILKQTCIMCQMCIKFSTNDTCNANVNEQQLMWLCCVVTGLQEQV